MAQTAKEREEIVKDHEKRIRDLEESMSKIADVAQAVSRHEKILKGGDDDDEKGLLERTRTIENIANTAAGWLKAIALLFLSQFVAIIFAGIYLFIKVLPVLLDLAK